MKRAMDAADAVSWALREMMVEGEVGEARMGGRGSLLPGSGSATDSLLRLIQLGTVIDNSKFRRDPDPPDEQGRVRDALAIAGEVHGMDATLGLGWREDGQWVDGRLDWAAWAPELGGVDLSPRDRAALPLSLSASAVLRDSGYAAVPPTWRPEGGGFEPVNFRRDEPVVERVREWLDLPGGRRIKFDRAWCPIHLRDARRIVVDRMRYVLWHMGLSRLAADLNGRLETIRLVGPAAPARPWTPAPAPVAVVAAPRPPVAAVRRRKRMTGVKLTAS